MKKKSVVSNQPTVDKPLTIIVTVMPPKRGLRTMIVSAAREGEMPLVLGGPFADRHVLLDQAYAQVMKREPQVVTLKEAKRVTKPGHEDVEEEEPGNREPDEDAEKSDQLVDPSTPLRSAQDAEKLPAIEGDDVEAAQELSDISDADEAMQEADNARMEAEREMLSTTDEVQDGEQD